MASLLKKLRFNTIVLLVDAGNIHHSGVINLCLIITKITPADWSTGAILHVYFPSFVSLLLPAFLRKNVAEGNFRSGFPFFYFFSGTAQSGSYPLFSYRMVEIQLKNLKYCEFSLDCP